MVNDQLEYKYLANFSNLPVLLLILNFQLLNDIIFDVYIWSMLIQGPPLRFHYGFTPIGDPINAFSVV